MTRSFNIPLWAAAVIGAVYSVIVGGFAAYLSARVMVAAITTDVEWLKLSRHELSLRLDRCCPPKETTR